MKKVSKARQIEINNETNNIATTFFVAFVGVVTLVTLLGISGTIQF